MKCLYHISQSSESIHLSNIRILLPFRNFWLLGTCHGWGWRSKYRTSSYSSDFAFIFLLQMHFSFIGKAQFRRATLFCDSSYLWWTDEKYPSIIIKYPPYLFHWLLIQVTRKPLKIIEHLPKTHFCGYWRFHKTFFFYVNFKLVIFKLIGYTFVL